MLEDEVVLLNALFHHLYGCTLQLTVSLPLLQGSLGLLSQLVQLLLVLQHQQFLLHLKQLLGGREVHVSLHGVNFGDFDLVLGCLGEGDELLGVDVVAPSLSRARFQFPLLLNELLVALAFDHSYFITTQVDELTGPLIGQWCPLPDKQSWFLSCSTHARLPSTPISLLLQVINSGQQWSGMVIFVQVRQQLFSLAQIIRLTSPMNSNCNLLLSLNTYAFAGAAQAVLSSLNLQELENLLDALQHLEQYCRLANLIRSRIFVCLAEQVDRTDYYLHYDTCNLTLMQEERTSNISQVCKEAYLQAILQNYREILQKGDQLLGQDFIEVKNSVFEPTLQLPPMARETTAPECRTVYQVILACVNSGSQMQQEGLFPMNQETLTFFFDCLKVHIALSNIYLCCLTEDYEHFAQTTYRFMVYRNAVLSLHELCAFPDLSEPMQLWNQLMGHHYKRSNRVFAKLLGFGAQQQFTEYGLLTGDELKAEGYIADYVEGLVDQSITIDSVAFCGHSKHVFQGEYSSLEAVLLQELGKQWPSLSSEKLGSMVQEWSDLGLRPSTIGKICEGFGGLLELRENICCSSDAFIENCARINLGKRTDLINIYVPCLS